MNPAYIGWLAAIATAGLTAYQTAPAATTAPVIPPEPAAIMAAAPADLPEGISFSDDGQTVVMEEFSSLEIDCNAGNGVLAISYVGEADLSGQLVGCEQTFEPFDGARENGFADVNIVTPVLVDNTLQLQAGQYTPIECRADHAGLEPLPNAASEGHMMLMCF